MVSDELEVICDGDGLAVFGDPLAVERFLSSAGVPSRELAIPRLSSTLSTGGGIAQAGSHVAAHSGRWVKLTKESAQAMNAGPLMKGSGEQFSRAIVTTAKGKTSKILEIIKPGSARALLTSPAALAGAAGIMAQLAMQQSMQEITDYLATIDEKVDDILRAQKDAALAEMIGVGFLIDEAMTIREHTGHVSAVTWSKVQAAGHTVATTQAYALRQLDALAAKLEAKAGVAALADTMKTAAGTVEEWLAVLARCFQLQDGLAVLELDRMLDSEPAELENHRAGLQVARRQRRELLAQSTLRLLERMDAVAGSANAKVLFHPFTSAAVVRTGNVVAADVMEFHERLGIDSRRDAIAARRWFDAATEARDKSIEAGIDGVNTVRRFGVKAFGDVRNAGERFGEELAERAQALRKKPESDADNQERVRN